MYASKYREGYVQGHTATIGRPGQAPQTGADPPERRGDAERALPPIVDTSIEDVARLEGRDRASETTGTAVAHRISSIGGSVPFALANAAFFIAWIVVNSGWVGIEPFDPYPFGGLTMAVSLEAIFLAVFVLISQNRQALQADKRARVDLQVNLIAEREITKLVELVHEVHAELGLQRGHDEEVAEMREHTAVEKLSDAIDEADARISADPTAAPAPQAEDR